MLISKPYGYLGGGYSVCMNCGDRRIGCHGVCKDYCEEVARKNKQKEQERKQCELRNAFCDVKQARTKSYHRSSNVPQRSHMK